jgi:UDP-N-acetylglucosamine acyltransferase
MPDIHASAVVDPNAEIGADVAIGPYCVIGPHVVLEPGCRLIAHVHITGHTTVGARTVLYPFVSLGTPPQSVKYRGGPTQLRIGADCDLRESVTMNIGTEDGGGLTTVGDRCLFMVNSHVGHDCRVGNNVIFANNAVIGGHVLVGDQVVLGGQAAVHQFVRIGECAMVAGVTGVAADVIPFGFALGQRAVLCGLNVVGLRRRGVTRSELQQIRTAYQALFESSGVFADRLAVAERDFTGNPFFARIIEFIRDGKSRPLMMPALLAASGDTPPDRAP